MSKPIARIMGALLTLSLLASCDHVSNPDPVQPTPMKVFDPVLAGKSFEYQVKKMWAMVYVDEIPYWVLDSGMVSLQVDSLSASKTRMWCSISIDVERRIFQEAPLPGFDSSESGKPATRYRLAARLKGYSGDTSFHFSGSPGMKILEAFFFRDAPIRIAFTPGQAASILDAPDGIPDVGLFGSILPDQAAFSGPYSIMSFAESAPISRVWPPIIRWKLGLRSIDGVDFHHGRDMFLRVNDVVW
jgi:hypothetical protein